MFINKKRKKELAIKYILSFHTNPYEKIKESEKNNTCIRTEPPLKNK